VPSKISACLNPLSSLFFTQYVNFNSYLAKVRILRLSPLQSFKILLVNSNPLRLNPPQWESCLEKGINTSSEIQKNNEKEFSDQDESKVDSPPHEQVFPVHI